MKKHINGKRVYIKNDKTQLCNTIHIGIYHSDNNMSGEFAIEFIELIKGKPLTARLKVYEDSWSVLWLFKDLLEKMAEIEDQKIQEPEFCKLLDSFGIENITNEEDLDIRNYNVNIKNKKLSIYFIKKFISEQFDIKIIEMDSNSRKRKYVIPRQICHYFAQKYSTASKTKIGRLIGNRNHATVINSIKTINNLIDTNVYFKDKIAELDFLMNI